MNEEGIKVSARPILLLTCFILNGSLMFCVFLRSKETMNISIGSFVRIENLCSAEIAFKFWFSNLQLFLLHFMLQIFNYYSNWSRLLIFIAVPGYIAVI